MGKTERNTHQDTSWSNSAKLKAVFWKQGRPVDILHRRAWEATGMSRVFLQKHRGHRTWVLSFPNLTRKNGPRRIHSQQKHPSRMKGNEHLSVPGGGTRRVSPQQKDSATSSKQKGDDKRRAWGPGKESEHGREHIRTDGGLFGSFSVIKRKARTKCVAPT